jgi:glycosyltransferase involved in cell wall biosynthesis
MTDERIAIVIPWFGPECKGGAESLAAELAHRLSAHAKVDVLTTCSRSFLSDWSENYFEPGVTVERAYSVRRFLVDQRAAQSFNTLNAALLGFDRSRLRMETGRVPLTSHLTFLTENINSASMMRYIAENRETYRRFLFLPYLYGTTIRGISAAGSRAVLLPCLHDESYAYLRPVERAVHRVPTLLFNSDGERDLALKIYGAGIAHKCIVVGSGVEVLHAPVGEAQLPAAIEPGKFILSLGRRDATKGTDLLVTAFRAAELADMKLVLAGPGNVSYTDGASVFDLGFVDDELRSVLLSQAAFLAQPSMNESFSRVIMESWAYERPVIAHDRCLATAGAVARSGGGITADGLEEWVDALRHLAELPEYGRTILGSAGKKYAVENADWSSVLERYLVAFSDPVPSASAERTGDRLAVHQVLETLEYGDAISNHAIAIRDHLRSSGYLSDILVGHVGPLVIDEARVFSPELVASSQGLIYHHSIGTELTDQVVASGLPTLMIYHNITPASFFRRLRPELAKRLDEGRADLGKLSRTFAAVAADSEFNAQELRELGYAEVDVLPIVADFRRFDVEPDFDAVAQVSDGQKTILFVGRYAPNKALHELIEVLACLRRAGSATRLVLAGRYDGNESYYAELRSKALELGVFESVIFTGLISDAQLLAYYLSADVFLSLSDHEGFCVPLVEAMAFNIPIIAFGSSAIPETLGNTGLLLTEKTDVNEIAALVRIVLEDEALRRTLVHDQRRRLGEFSSAFTLAKLDELMAKLMAQPVAAS